MQRSIKQLFLHAREALQPLPLCVSFVYLRPKGEEHSTSKKLRRWSIEGTLMISSYAFAINGTKYMPPF